VPYASNADKVDGYHANGLLTAATLGASGNSTTISVTVGGTTKTDSVTVPYATNSDTVDGYHASNLYTSISDWMSKVGNTKSITVGGDANTYYPVVISATGDKTSINIISIWKNLGSATASYSGNHSNETSSMWLMFEGRSCTWDGNGGYYRTLYKSQPYATLISEATTVYSSVGVLCVYLRGGGTEYNISTTYPASITVYLSATNIGSSTYPANVTPRTDIGNGGIINGTFYGNCTGSAGSVAWGNVTSKPAASGNATTPVYWNGSGFTNCTAYGSASVNYANSAGAVAWANVSSKPATATRWPTWDEVTSKPLSGTSGNNGPVWGNYVPVKSDGVMEIGKYLDFHNSSNDGVDYAVRLQCQGNNQVVINLPTAAGTLALTSNITKSAVGLGNVANYDQSKAIKSITRSGTTFTYTALDGTTGTFTQQDNNTDVNVSQTYSTSNQESPILLKNGTGIGNITSGTIFAAGMTVNPSTSSLSVGGHLSVSGNLAVTGTGSFGNNVSCTGVLRTIESSDPGTAGKETFKALSYTPAPYGIVFKGYSDGTHSIQVKREANNTEFFPLSLNPQGGDVKINGYDAIHSGNIFSILGNSILPPLSGHTDVFRIKMTNFAWFSTGSVKVPFLIRGGVNEQIHFPVFSTFGIIYISASNYTVPLQGWSWWCFGDGNGVSVQYNTNNGYLHISISKSGCGWAVWYYVPFVVYSNGINYKGLTTLEDQYSNSGMFALD